MEFLLDTDTCIYAIKEHGSVVEAMRSLTRDDMGVSVVTEAELRTGVAKSASPMKALHNVENFLRPLTVIDFTSRDAIVYAQVRAKLERAGTPIGALDTIIAAQAVARDLTLVTNNEREFRRVSGLRIQNWRR
jgi:tRNA(fMet)-specific endonuclease VapC